MTRLLFSVALAALLAVTTAKAAELPESIKQAGTLRLTVNSSLRPDGIFDRTTNELVGRHIDLANELAKRLVARNCLERNAVRRAHSLIADQAR